MYDPAALAEYERCFADAEARHAMLEDYRAGASVDYDLDAADAAAGHRVSRHRCSCCGAPAASSAVARTTR